MGSDFPRSPRVQKGGLVAYQFPELLPTIIVFQYNPDEVSRSIQAPVNASPSIARVVPSTFWAYAS